MRLIHRGRDAIFTVRVRRGKRPLDITDIDISCSVRGRDGSLLFDATVEKTEPTRGVCVVRFPREETANLSPNSVIVFDLRFVFPDGTVRNYPPQPIEVKVVEPVT